MGTLNMVHIRSPVLRGQPLPKILTRLHIVAVEHCRQIQAECKAQQEEACALRQELGSLNEDIE